MPTLAQAPSVKFTGLKKGRPHFDFGEFHVAPRWLIDLLGSRSVTVKDGKLFRDAKEIAPGSVVTP